MQVGDILLRKGDFVLTATPDMPVAEAARIMNRNRIGLLVMCNDKGKVAGVLSERDIVRGLAEQPDRIAEMLVGELATTEVATCEVDEHPVSVLKRMSQAGIRHMPVVQYGGLKGLVSNRDLYEFLRRESDAEERALMVSEFNFL